MRYEGHRCTTYRGKLNNPDKLLTSIHAPPLLCTHWRRYRTTPAHSIGVRSSQLLLSFQITENGERHSSSQTTEVDWGSFSHAPLPLPPSSPPPTLSTLGNWSAVDSHYRRRPAHPLYRSPSSISLLLHSHSIVILLNGAFLTWDSHFPCSNITVCSRANYLTHTESESLLQSVEISLHFVPEIRNEPSFPSTVRFLTTKQKHLDFLTQCSQLLV